MLRSLGVWDVKETQKRKLMYDGNGIPSKEVSCVEGRLSRTQKTALLRIFKLNKSYPKRWFTECEIKHVFPTTLKALVEKGFLNTKFSEADDEVQYWQYTGKKF